MLACKGPLPEFIALFLQYEADIERAQEHYEEDGYVIAGGTALFFAAWGSRLESVRLLLDAGADPNRPANAPDGPRTPLDAAYRRELRSPDGPEIVRALIAAGATVPNQ